MDNNKLYLVINDGNSPVAITTKTGGLLVPGMKDGNPGSMPLMLDDIIYVNSTSNAFKIGLLHFEDEFEEEIQTTIRNLNWKNILTNAEIEDIVLHPTADKLQKIVDIVEPAYFERVRSVYTGLVNSGREISQKVGTVVDTRYSEIMNRKFRSDIQLKQKQSDDSSVSRKEYDDLVAQNKKLMEMMEQLMANKSAVVADKVVEEKVEEAPVKKAPVKSTAKSTTKSTAAKTTTAKAGTKKTSNQ